MTTLRHEIRIQAPPSAVFAVLSDLEAVQHYNPLVASTRYVSQTRDGPGAARHCDFKDKGFSHERVTDSVPGRVHAMEVVKSSWPLTHCRWRTELQPDGAGTWLVQETVYGVRFGLLGRAMDSLLMRRKFDAIMRDIHAGLKRHVETS